MCGTPARLALQIAPPPDGRSIHLYVCASCAPGCTCRLKCCLQPQHNAWLCRAAAKWPLLDASYRWPSRSVTPFSAIYTSPSSGGSARSSHSTSLARPLQPHSRPCHRVATRGHRASGEGGRGNLTGALGDQKADWSSC